MRWPRIAAPALSAFLFGLYLGALLGLHAGARPSSELRESWRAPPPGGWPCWVVAGPGVTVTAREGEVRVVDAETRDVLLLGWGRTLYPGPDFVPVDTRAFGGGFLPRRPRR